MNGLRYRIVEADGKTGCGIMPLEQEPNHHPIGGAILVPHPSHDDSNDRTPENRRN